MRNPDNWHETLRPATLKKAGYRCQQCGAPSSKDVVYQPDETWIPADIYTRQAGDRHKKVVLSVVRLNGIGWDCRPQNLSALCQRHAVKHHARVTDECRKMRPYHEVGRLCELITKAEKPLFLSVVLGRLSAYRAQIEHMRWIYERRRAKGFSSDWDRAYQRQLLRLISDSQKVKDAVAVAVWPAVDNPELYLDAYLEDPFTHLQKPL